MVELTKAEFIDYLNGCVKFKPENQHDSDKVKKALHKLLLIIHPDKCKDKYENPCLKRLFKKILKKEDNFLEDDCSKVTEIFLNAFKKYFTDKHSTDKHSTEKFKENNWESDILDLLLIIIFNLYLACKRLNNQPKKSESIKLITGGANINLFSLLIIFVSYFLIMKTLMIIDKVSSITFDEAGKYFKNQDSIIADTSDLSKFLNHASIDLIYDIDNSEKNIVNYASNIVNSLIKSDILGIQIPPYIIPSSIIDTLNDAYIKIQKINELKNSGEAGEAEEAIEDTKKETMFSLKGLHTILSTALDAKDKIKTYLNLKNVDNDDNKIKSYSKQSVKNTIESYKISELLTLLKPLLKAYPGLAAYQIIFISLDDLTNVFWFEEKLDSILDITKFVDDILQLVIYCSDNYLFDNGNGQMNAIKDIDQSSLSNSQYTKNDIGNTAELITEIFPEDKVEIMRDFSDSNIPGGELFIRNRSNFWFKKMLQQFKNITKDKKIMKKIVNASIELVPKDEDNLDIQSKSFLKKFYQKFHEEMTSNKVGDIMPTGIGGRIRKTNKNKSKNKSKNKRKNTFKRRK